MVTAGVFLVARMSPLFELAPAARDVVIVIGAVTAFFAATVGLVQNDIKRVIAYSTCSQLGYMFVAMGVGAYGIGMFHLFTHAFFKALLFLGAGSVIHAMSGEQDMRKMGGLAPHIRITWAMMLIGTSRTDGCRHSRSLWLRRFPLQGRDHRERFCLPCSPPHAGLRSAGDRGLLHLVLFLAPGLHDLQRRAAR
jgi:multisubunit Na+/H+ antiporter MnhG subunit